MTNTFVVPPLFQPVISHLQDEFRGIRTGRAAASLVELIKIDMYGASVSLRDLSSIIVDDAQTLRIEPYDKTSVPSIVKGIEASGLGVTPSVSGTVIRLSFPPLTTERRVELTGVIRKAAEDSRIMLRNIREHELKDLKRLNEEKELSEDELEKEKKNLQSKVDETQNIIAEMVKGKEEEIMQV